MCFAHERMGESPRLHQPPGITCFMIQQWPIHPALAPAEDDVPARRMHHDRRLRLTLLTAWCAVAFAGCSAQSAPAGREVADTGKPTQRAGGGSGDRGPTERPRDNGRRAATFSGHHLLSSIRRHATADRPSHLRGNHAAAAGDCQ